MKNLILSKNFGLNPILGVCFFCGEYTGAIGLPGRLPNDVEAPREAVLDYVPCPACQEKIKDKHFVVEVTVATGNQRPIIPGYAPTGAYWILEPSNGVFENPVTLISPTNAREVGLYGDTHGTA
jgi:hypothetical protein